MKPLPLELEIKIDEIKSWMFEGDQKEVAKRSGDTCSRVSQMLNKKITPTKKVIESGIEVMNENKVAFEIQPTMKIAI
jgi:hypothetical protein